MLLLQTQITGMFDAVSIGTWIISGLLTIIGILIAVIWNWNKSEATERKAEQKQQHTDTLLLIAKVDAKTDDLTKAHYAHQLEFAAFKAVVNISQGRPYNYDITNAGKNIKDTDR